MYTEHLLCLVYAAVTAVIDIVVIPVTSPYPTILAVQLIVNSLIAATTQPIRLL